MVDLGRGAAGRFRFWALSARRAQAAVSALIQGIIRRRRVASRLTSSESWVKIAIDNGHVVRQLSDPVFAVGSQNATPGWISK